MATLDTESLVQTLDSENMLQALADLPDQIEAAWFHSQALALPTHYIQSTNVLVVGIGAGAVSGLVAQAVAQSTSRKPVVVLEQGSLPHYVDSHTLVIGISYSGKTTETVTALAEAGRRGAKLIGLSTGGDIGAICRKYRAPHFVIQYGAQSRSALGYLVIPLLAILQRLNVIEIERPNEAIAGLAAALRSTGANYLPTVPTAHNVAKQLAESTAGKLLLIVGSSATRPALRRWQMQLQQNAKLMSAIDEVPGGIYTTLEGLTFPAIVSEQLMIIQLRSAFDDLLTSSAHNAYSALARKRRISLQDILLPGSRSLIDELLGLILLGDYISYYLALLGGVDPSSTPTMLELQQLRASDSTQ